MILRKILTGKCPKCGKGNVFQDSILKYNLGKMNAECSECKLSFSKEPGFYWGAMFVSYGLAVIEIILCYLFYISFINNQMGNNFLWMIVAVILVLAPFNFKLSRIIWLYIFPK